MKWHSLLAIGLATTALPRAAHADLATDVSVLRAARSAYGPVVQLKPRLYERGERGPLPIPPELLDPKTPACVTLSILGVRELHFAVRFSQLDPGAPSTAFGEASVAGSSEVTRCGANKPYLAAVLLEMRSPRGIVEVLLSSAAGRVPPLSALLPNRDPGLELPLGESGARPAPAPLAARLERLTTRARQDGAQSVGIAQVQAGEEGAGAESIALDAGCHELSLLAESSQGPSSAVDLDFELLDAESGARLGSDRAEDADASLSLCMGSASRTELRFVGGPARAALSLVHVRFDLPPGLPASWGPEARGRMAKVARDARLRLATQPFYSSLGVQGTTSLPLEVEPGVCYSALLVSLRGEVRNLSLSARVRAAGESPRWVSDTDGGALSFCAHGGRHATLEVSSEGASLAWLLSVWTTGRSAIGARAP